MTTIVLIAERQRISFGPHAIARYAERACRHDDTTQATDELAVLLDRHGRIALTAPRWSHPSEAQRTTTAWLMLGDDIAFPLGQAPSGCLTAMTCLCRAGVGARHKPHAHKGRPSGKNASAERREWHQRREHERMKADLEEAA